MNQELQNSVLRRVEALPGQTGVCYKNLATGWEFKTGTDKPYLAASIIKLPMFLAILKWVQEGKASLQEKIVVRQADKVPICGALTLFTEDVETDVETLCRLMISISDNTATNVLIRRFGVEAYEQAFAEMGLQETRLMRCLYDEEGAKEGKCNVFSLTEIAGLLEQLYRGGFVNSEVSRMAVDVLMQQQVKSKLAGALGWDAPIAHKTGEDTGTTHDVGILYAKQPFLLCFAGNDTDVAAFEAEMRRIAWELYQDAEQSD